MIINFADKQTELIWKGRRNRKLPHDIQARAGDRLALLDAAELLEDLRNPPSNRLHPLKDERVGQHAISINDQWRICFRWKDGNAYDVEITDYH